MLTFVPIEFYFFYNAWLALHLPEMSTNGRKSETTDQASQPLYNRFTFYSIKEWVTDGPGAALVTKASAPTMSAGDTAEMARTQYQAQANAAAARLPNRNSNNPPATGNLLQRFQAEAPKDTGIVDPGAGTGIAPAAAGGEEEHVEKLSSEQEKLLRENQQRLEQENQRLLQQLEREKQSLLERAQEQRHKELHQQELIDAADETVDDFLVDLEELEEDERSLMHVFEQPAVDQRAVAGNLLQDPHRSRFTYRDVDDFKDPVKHDLFGTTTVSTFQQVQDGDYYKAAIARASQVRELTPDVLKRKGYFEAIAPLPDKYYHFSSPYIYEESRLDCTGVKVGWLQHEYYTSIVAPFKRVELPRTDMKACPVHSANVTLSVGYNCLMDNGIDYVQLAQHRINRVMMGPLLGTAALKRIVFPVCFTILFEALVPPYLPTPVHNTAIQYGDTACLGTVVEKVNGAGIYDPPGQRKLFNVVTPKEVVQAVGYLLDKVGAFLDWIRDDPKYSRQLHDFLHSTLGVLQNGPPVYVEKAGGGIVALNAAFEKVCDEIAKMTVYVVNKALTPPSFKCPESKKKKSFLDDFKDEFTIYPRSGTHKELKKFIGGVLAMIKGEVNPGPPNDPRLRHLRSQLVAALQEEKFVEKLYPEALVALQHDEEFYEKMYALHMGKAEKAKVNFDRLAEHETKVAKKKAAEALRAAAAMPALTAELPSGMAAAFAAHAEAHNTLVRRELRENALDGTVNGIPTTGTQRNQQPAPQISAGGAGGGTAEDDGDVEMVDASTLGATLLALQNVTDADIARELKTELEVSSTSRGNVLPGATGHGLANIMAGLGLFQIPDIVDGVDLIAATENWSLPYGEMWANFSDDQLHEFICRLCQGKASSWFPVLLLLVLLSPRDFKLAPFFLYCLQLLMTV